MAVRLDWAALAAEEVASAHADETRTESGIILGVYGGARLRSWVKFRGEPAQTFYETPAEFATRWLAFRDDPEQEVCIFHEHAFGQPVFLFREALEHLMYVQVTYPTTEQGRSTPGSIW